MPNSRSSTRRARGVLQHDWARTDVRKADIVVQSHDVANRAFVAALARLRERRRLLVLALQSEHSERRGVSLSAAAHTAASHARYLHTQSHACAGRPRATCSCGTGSKRGICTEPAGNTCTSACIAYMAERAETKQLSQSQLSQLAKREFAVLSLHALPAKDSANNIAERECTRALTQVHGKLVKQ